MPRVLTAFLLLLVSCAPCYASGNTLYFENLLSYRHEYASDRTENIILDRLTCRGLFSYGTDRMGGEVTPFFETRRQLDIHKWYMNSLGTATEITYRKLATFALNLQYTWMDVPGDYFTKKPDLGRDRIELSPAATIDLPIYGHGDFGLYLEGLDYFYYDIEHQIPLRNELGLGLKLALNRHICLGLGWHHTDWIHDFDSDQAEVSAKILFP